MEEIDLAVLALPRNFMDFGGPSHAIALFLGVSIGGGGFSPIENGNESFEYPPCSLKPYEKINLAYQSTISTYVFFSFLSIFF